MRLMRADVIVAAASLGLALGCAHPPASPAGPPEAGPPPADASPQASAAPPPRAEPLPPPAGPHPLNDAPAPGMNLALGAPPPKSPDPALLALGPSLNAPRYHSIHVEPRQTSDSAQVKLAEMVLAPLAAQTSRLMRHDPQLDAAAHYIAQYSLIHGAPPPEAVVQGLMLRAGATAQVRLTHVRSARGGNAPAQLDGEWRSASASLSASRTAMSFGVARLPFGEDGTLQVVMVGEDRVLLDGFPRTLTPGETLTLSGRMPALYTQARMFGEGDEGIWGRGIEVDVAGSFKVDYPLPSKPGVYYLEMTALFAPDGTQAPSARVERQLLLPLYIGVKPPEDLPTSMLFPPADPPPAAIPEAILGMYNLARSKAGVAPLELDPAGVALAGRIAEGSSRGAPPPTSVEVARRLGSEGVPVGRLHQWNVASDALLLLAQGNLNAPSHRRVILDPEMVRLAVGTAPGSEESARYVEYLYGLVAPLEPGDERARVLELVREGRAAVTLPGYLVDPAAEAIVQGVAQEVCDLQRAPDQVDLVFPRLKAGKVPYGKGRYSWSMSINPFDEADLKAKQQKIVETPYSHIALGACQVQVGTGPTRHYWLVVLYDLK